MKTTLLKIAFFLTLCSTVTAHPSGHSGHAGEVIGHLLSDPYHLLAVFGAVGALFACLSIKRLLSRKH
ncbi:MAG: hypothetical protein CBC33_001950 [Coraliomargarita sp. TMED73]|nr:MAG: hypothetical protein CBC33_001950 [Coraliomargarita sp. TMED73]